MKILGIDPGSARMGYGVIESERSKLQFIDAGTIEATGKTSAEKLAVIGTELKLLLKNCRPDLVGIERLFFAKNRKTALEVAEARGVALYLIRQAGATIVELAPNEIKAAVTGYGGADKMGVSKMVKIILNAGPLKGHDDATDALAIAIAATRRNLIPNAMG